MTPRTESPRPDLPRPELSIGHPEFDAFLSARVGADADGVELSVMSALARLDLDPWSETARLSDLPRHAAVEALTLMLGKLPAGSWKPADELRNLADLAHRLADCLPRSHRPVDRHVHRHVHRHGAVFRPPLWLFYAAIAVGFYMLFSQVQFDHQLEPARPSTQQ